MRECERCGKTEFARERKLKRCSRCKIVLYCSEKCQKSDWKRHKRTCRPHNDSEPLPECGLCASRTGPFKYTECCNRLLCDDECSYMIGSYSRLHCARNHGRYSLCGNHYDEQHDGKWQTCEKCKDDTRFKPSNGDASVNYEFAYRSGNAPHAPFKFNFDEDAIKFDWNTIHLPECDFCKRRVDTLLENFVVKGNGFYCEKCGHGTQHSGCTCLPIHIQNSMQKQ